MPKGAWQRVDHFVICINNLKTIRLVWMARPVAIEAMGGAGGSRIEGEDAGSGTAGAALEA